MRRILVLVVTPWMAIVLLSGVRASAATYPGPTSPTTVQVLPATQATTPPHGAATPGSSLPFTGTDALILLAFAGAVLVPGVGLLVVSRRHSRVRRA